MSTAPPMTAAPTATSGQGVSIAARWRSALATEWRLQARSGVPLGAAISTAGWVVLLRIVPVAVRPTAAAWVLFVEVTALGFFAAPALAVVERANGVIAATAMTRWRPGAALAIRMTLMGAWAAASALAVTAAGGLVNPAAVLVGVLAATGLLTLLSLAALGRAETLTAWMPRVPLVAVPVLVPAMVAAAQISDHPALALSPLTGAWHWWSGGPSGAALAWLLASMAAVAWWVVRSGWSVSPPDDAPAPAVAAAAGEPEVGCIAPAGPGTRRWHRRLVAVRSQARVDRRTLGGDALVVMLVAGVPIVAIAVRVATGPLLGWVEGRWGVDLAPHLPALWAFLLVVHTTTMFGAVTGLLLLEDRDAGLEPAIATTAAGPGTVLAWRLGGAGPAAGRPGPRPGGRHGRHEGAVTAAVRPRAVVAGRRTGRVAVRRGADGLVRPGAVGSHARRRRRRRRRCDRYHPGRGGCCPGPPAPVDRSALNPAGSGVAGQVDPGVVGSGRPGARPSPG